jgi:two-component sensor histidine kinase
MACILALACYAFLIALVLRRARRRKAARYFLFYLIGMTAWQAGQTLVAFTTNLEVALVGYRIVAAFGPSFGFFYAMFVRELLDIRSARWLAPVGYALLVICPLYTFLGGPGVVLGVYLQPDTPMYLPDLGFVTVIMGLSVYGYMLYALAHLVAARMQSTSPIERNRLLYLIIGVPIVILGSAANFSEVLRGYPIDMVANVLNAVLTAFAILRYRLLDIQLVLRRGLRYSVTTVIIGMLYFLLVELAVQVLDLVAGYQVLLLSVALAAVAAVVVQPLRDGLQARVDRLFFRDRYDAAQMLQRVSESSAAMLDAEALTAMIVTEVCETMHIERAAFFLRDQEGGYSLAASRGLESEATVKPAEWRLRADHPLIAYLSTHPQVFASQELDRLPIARAFRLEERERWKHLAAELLVPLITQGALVGLLAVGQKLSGVEYGMGDETVLMTLANQSAVAVENARLYATVQRQLANQRRAEERLLESLHEKEVLLKEIHHRVKNNLQVIYSLLSLQVQYAHDQGTVDVLRDSQNRIRSMALIHEKLYQSANLADIDFGEYLRTLSSQLHRSYATGDRVVRLVVNTAPIRLPLDTALPCALIASELISNALKHAFVGRPEGVLWVHICGSSDGHVELEVADDGVGMPKAPEGEIKNPSTLGMQLVDGLVRQLDGSIQLMNGVGTRFLVSFPVEAT